MYLSIRVQRLAAFAAAAILFVLTTGCAPTVKKPTARETATAQWKATRASVLANLGRDQYKGGNFDQARQSVSDALKLDPENASIRVLSAKIAVEQSQLELAEKELRLARQFDPRNAEADYISGVVYQRWQKPDLAYEFYSQASEKAPSELAFLMAKAEMLVSMDRA